MVASEAGLAFIREREQIKGFDSPTSGIQLLEKKSKSDATPTVEGISAVTLLFLTLETKQRNYDKQIKASINKNISLFHLMNLTC